MSFVFSSEDGKFTALTGVPKIKSFLLTFFFVQNSLQD
ncbi:hypothetical protein C723_2202 [Christiangramia flava JLT2011]|uniref:Uncharacterized protein n=1 Tax=Christiangramia flava JLT2011 TaxID=1229726 RepID=A0A1L7I6R4_9FLAO|nr:hypothetical protein GRFL_2566 [Christiangramia flava JLT2011]OSS38811.1 hypothetical protein C723_2202 [Christiangramia flava JLT2011]